MTPTQFAIAAIGQQALIDAIEALDEDPSLCGDSPADVRNWLRERADALLQGA